MNSALQTHAHVAPHVPAPGSQDHGFIARLRVLADRSGSASALARRAGISQSGLQRYLSGGEPTRKVLIALAEAGGVDLQWLLTGQGYMGDAASRRDEGDATLIRLPLHAASAGTTAEPRQLPGLAFCSAWLQRHGLAAEHLAALSIHGYSMEPTLRNGDTVLIDTARQDLAEGRIYVVCSANKLLVKRVQSRHDDRVRMTSDNPLFPATEGPASGINVVGQVVWRGSLV